MAQITRPYTRYLVPGVCGDIISLTIYIYMYDEQTLSSRFSIMLLLVLESKNVYKHEQKQVRNLNAALLLSLPTLQYIDRVD